MDITVGQYTLTKPADAGGRLSMLLWGPAGAGKTTLAATAPGKKLLINFDPDGPASLTHRDDVYVLDLAGEKHNVIEEFKKDNPFGIETMLKANPDITTVIVDSLTLFIQKATENAVFHVASAKLENPGMKGYGHRTALVLRLVQWVLAMTKRLNVHCVLITHEGSPERNEEGIVLAISPLLSDKTTNSIGAMLSEIWFLNRTDKGRIIAIRPCRSRRPMKTRMFVENKTLEFTWKDDEGLETWYYLWKSNDFKKILAPSQ